LERLRDKGYRVSDANIRRGLSSVYWPGRFEVLRREPVFILDGAHNPHGIAATAESLKCHFGARKLVFLVGVMADKDVTAMMDCIAPLAQAFIAAEPHSPRAMRAETLAALLSGYGVPVTPCADVDEGVAEAIRLAGRDGVVAALGSLYFSGDVRRAVQASLAGDRK
jgi:dihydrofolate synthase/folylpolyglutamate synthase